MFAGISPFQPNNRLDWGRTWYLLMFACVLSVQLISFSDVLFSFNSIQFDSTLFDLIWFCILSMLLNNSIVPTEKEQRLLVLWLVGLVLKRNVQDWRQADCLFPRAPPAMRCSSEARTCIVYPSGTLITTGLELRRLAGLRLGGEKQQAKPYGHFPPLLSSLL